MTITDAITMVLSESDRPLGHKEIFERIIEKEYYSFGAKDPRAVVRSKLRKHCFGVDFPSASPKKLFVIDNAKASSRNALYKLYDNCQNESEKIKVQNDELPEEKLHTAHKRHIELVGQQLLDYIKQSEPEFFESLVVRLLLSMGYGWDKSKSGNVTGGKGDEGIDGIINEDKLGLEKIYIQAKRYGTNHVSPSDVRDFVGAMAIKGARKGVFFTSSTFSAQAKKHAQDAQNMTITLIDGAMLTDLLVQNGLGVAIANTYNVFEVDKNFFSLD